MVSVRLFKLGAADLSRVLVSSPEGFEPTRAEHNGLAGHRLNHSAKATWLIEFRSTEKGYMFLGIIKLTKIMNNRPMAISRWAGSWGTDQGALPAPWQNEPGRPDGMR